MLPDLRIDELAAMLFKALKRAFLVRSHQPRITRYVGGEDRCKTATGGHIWAVGQPRAAVPDAAIKKYTPLGHPVSPAFLRR